LLVPERNVDAVVSLLRARRPDAVVMLHKPSQIFAPGNALYQRLENALAP
jgi:hypothetical protein